MRKLKMVSLVLVMSMLCMVLSGCMALDLGVTINKDGSGKMTGYMGLSKEMMDAINEWSGDEGGFDIYEEEDMVKRIYKGIEYWGEYDEMTFDSVADFNDNMSSLNDGDNLYGIETGSVKLDQDSNGYFTLTYVVTPQTANMTNIIEDSELDMGELTPVDYEAFAKSLYVNMSYTFPIAVKQVEGPTDGITVQGNTVTMVVTEMQTPTTGTMTYIFTTNPDGIVEEPEIKYVEFNDVKPGTWYYEAVSAMAAGGIVNGMGNNMYMPNNTLTYAQFCQILANAKGMETGTDANGWWAGKAIDSCVNAGFVNSLGENNATNYDVPISREVAIVGMYRASRDFMFDVSPVYSFTSSDIPDYSSISGQYQDEVLDAYNIGITTGMDDAHTFAPETSLTRAQICQLFFNLNWTSPKTLVG